MVRERTAAASRRSSRPRSPRSRGRACGNARRSWSGSRAGPARSGATAATPGARAGSRPAASGTSGRCASRPRCGRAAAARDLPRVQRVVILEGVAVERDHLGETRAPRCARVADAQRLAFEIHARFWHTRAPRCGRIPGPKRTWGPGSRAAARAPGTLRSSSPPPAADLDGGSRCACGAQRRARARRRARRSGRARAAERPALPRALLRRGAVGAILGRSTRGSPPPSSPSSSTTASRGWWCARRSSTCRRARHARARARRAAARACRARDDVAPSGRRGAAGDPHTSGTTGQPKGAVLPHRKTYWNTRNAELYFELAPDSVVVTPIPSSTPSG